MLPGYFVGFKADLGRLDGKGGLSASTRLIHIQLMGTSKPSSELKSKAEPMMPRHIKHKYLDSDPENTRIYSYYLYGEGSLTWTSLSAGETAQVRLAVSPRNAWSFCVVPGGRLFLTGGGPSNEVHSVDINKDFAVIKQRNLITTRYAHSSVYHQGYLYVIGGWNEQQCQVDCERLQVVDALEWEQIPPLPAKNSGAGTIKLEECLYVFGGYTLTGYDLTDTIHEFNFATFTWRTLEVKMPGLQYWTPVFKQSKDADECYIVTENALWIFRPNEPSLVKLRDLTEAAQVMQSWFGPSYYRNDMLYCAPYEGPPKAFVIGSIA
jgi:hypothetical protein